MTQLQNRAPGRGIDRRSIVKGAAWAAPVVAVAVATPLAAASTGNASVEFTDSQTALLQLHVIDSESVLTAQALITVPTEFTVTNGTGAIDDPNATVTVTVGRPSGVNISVGRARGFGVYSYNGVVTPSSSRSVSYQSFPVTGTPYGFPVTTYTATQPVSVASDGTLAVPIEFGLAGTNDALAVSALTTFPVTLTITFSDGETLTASSSISVPVGAGVL